MNFRDPRLQPMVWIFFLTLAAFTLGQLSERAFRGDLFWVLVICNVVIIVGALFLLIREVWKRNLPR
jgi:hypothetical protein